MRAEKETPRVIVYVRINRAPRVCLSAVRLGPLLVFCVSVPDWA